jgi:hypothetical protein
VKQFFNKLLIYAYCPLHPTFCPSGLFTAGVKFFVTRYLCYAFQRLLDLLLGYQLNAAYYVKFFTDLRGEILGTAHPTRPCFFPRSALCPGLQVGIADRNSPPHADLAKLWIRISRHDLGPFLAKEIGHLQPFSSNALYLGLCPVAGRIIKEKNCLQ